MKCKAVVATVIILLFLMEMMMARATVISPPQTINLEEMMMARATVISPPQTINLEGGSEDQQGNWQGGYWTFTVAVDQADSLVGKVYLPANTTTGKLDDGSEIKTRKTVEIDIKPEQAYYRRLIELAPIEDRLISPRVYRGGMNRVLGICWWDLSNSINPMAAEYYTWAEAGWEKYTVFSVSVYVDGVLAGTTEFNTEKGIKDLVVSTNKGDILVKNLGRLEGDYSEPQVPDIVLFNEKYIYTTDAIQYIRYDHGSQIRYYKNVKESYMSYIENSKAFSTYWWGTTRWNPTSTDASVAGSPAPFMNPGDWGYDIIPPDKGWKASDELFNLGREPVKPVIYPEEGADSLIAYLNKMCSEGDIADRWLTGYNWTIEYADKTPNAIVVDIPWGAYSGSPVVTFYVPSALADTFVYRLPIADVRIENGTWTDGSEIGAAGTKTCSLELRQYAKVESSATIFAETTTNRASVSPASMTVTMKPNETKTVTFEVSNLGVESDSSGTVLFNVKRSWDDVKTGEYQLEFKLIAPVIPENITDVINRTTPTEPKKTEAVPENSDITIAAMVCATITVVCIAWIAMNENRRKKATELAAKTARGSLGLAKTLVRPIWQRYKVPIASLTVGAILFFGGLLWQSYSPLKIFPIKVQILGLTLLSTSWEALAGIALGFILLIVGMISLVQAGIISPIANNTPVNTVAKTLIRRVKKKTRSNPRNGK